jgi:hypothetical protein
MNMNYDGGINIGFKGQYRLQVIDAVSHEIVSDYGWHPNLILNNGMDILGNLAGPSIGVLSSYGVVGTGSRPNYIASGTSTITQSGAYIGLSNHTGLLSFTQSVWTNGTSSYTSSVDIGDLIVDQDMSQSMVVWVSGSLLYITGTSLNYTTPKTFTVWKTSQAGLQGEYIRSSTYLVGSSSVLGWNCGTVVSGSTTTMRRTYDFPAETASQSYTEVGCSWNGIPNGGLFSRIVLPQSVNLAPQQSLRMTYDLFTSYGPFSPVYKTASIVGWPVSPATDTSGVECLQNFLPSMVQTDGNSSGLAGLDPTGLYSYNFFVFASTVNTPLYTGSAGVNMGVNRLGDYAVSNTTTSTPYVSGTYTTVKYGTLSMYQAVSSQIYSIGFGQIAGYYPYNSGGQIMVFLFNQPQTKTNLQTLTLGWRWTWNRIIQ